MAERVFARKLTKAGFVDVEIFGHTMYGIDDIEAYPFFTPELIRTMRRVLSPQQQCNLATSVIVRGRKSQAAA